MHAAAMPLTASSRLCAVFAGLLLGYNDDELVAGWQVG